jgi:hypothetical protein
MPSAIGFENRSTGHNIMDVRMIGHLPSPGMRHAKEAE